MHFDAAVNWPDETNHFMNLENTEVLRLRKLMHENILKVEKENLETIQKELSTQTETNIKTIHPSNDSKKIPKHSIGPSSATLQTRSTSFKRMKEHQPSLLKVQRPSNVKSSELNSANVCKNAHPNCQYSFIHFLNHFHSSFLSSKTQRNFQPCDLKDKYTACAVPLAPPSQRKEIIDLEQDLLSHKSSVCVPTNVAYHVITEDIPKKLTVQALPSISIVGRKPTSNENNRFEEIRERNYAAGDHITTTVLPAVSEEVRNRITSINLSSTQINKASASEDKCDQSSRLHPKKSIFTQSSLNDGSLQIQPDKGFLKQIIKEVLQEFQYESAQEITQGSTDNNFLLQQNEEKITSPENDCNLDSFIGNADSHAKDAATVVSPNIFIKSNYTQTNSDLPQPVSNEMDIKSLIHKVVLEMQQNSILKSSQSREEPSNAFKIETVHRDIQVDLKQCEMKQEVKSHTSKAVQASFITASETLHTERANETPDLIDRFAGGDFEVTTNADIMKTIGIPKYLEESTEAAATSEVPSKLESVLNFIYNRFCRETGELSLSTERILANNPPPSIRTREVSIQFNPVSTSTKSTATSEVALIDASNQCDDFSPHQVEEKDVRHASVQVLPELEMVKSVQEKVDSSVQCEHPALAMKDSCVQTLEFPNPTENSANSSVSSTPVSDSIFLDDMLSEGEVCLPWNLRLLSLADKATAQSSKHATEASDKEKDYSLSEGEIPPKYLQHFNLAQSPSYDSSSDAYTDPQNIPTPTPQRQFVIGPQVEPLPFTSLGRRYHWQASSSSLSEGEVKDSSTWLSEGEVPYGFLRHRLALQQAIAVQCPGSNTVASQHESGMMHRNMLDSRNLGEISQLQENFGHSSFDLSEGEFIGRPETPYQSTPFASFLDTVNEEK